MKSTFQLFLILVIVGTILEISDASKILVLLPIATSYDKTVFEPLIQALALRDHHVTVVSPVASSGFPRSVKEIHPTTLEELGYGQGFQNGKGLLQSRKELKSSYFPMLWNSSIVEYGCHQLYKDVEIKYLMKGLKKFDLAIVNGLQNECALGLVEYFRVPHIYLTTMPAPNYVVGRFGHYFPTSFVSSPFTSFDDQMTFPERSVNFIVETILVLFAKHYLYPTYEEIYRGYVGAETQSIEEIEDNVGVILMNTNFIMTYPRPLPPNIIEIGGMHCRPPRPLPTGLDKFLSEGGEGFIYFSLGSQFQPKDMSDEFISLLIKVFSSLDERVIWKWDEDNYELPPNVMTSQWLPQQDILGHRNIKLFMSNGDLLSTQEAIYHGVPILGIPLTGEHDLNMRQAEKAGFAMTWEVLDMNETRLMELVDRMLIEPHYKARAKQFSKMYKELPDIALEKALFWVDYVIRNKGAPHLRSSSKDLNYFQYHSFDVIMFLISVLLLTTYLLYLVISTFCFKQDKSSSRDNRNGSYVDVKKYD